MLALIIAILGSAMISLMIRLSKNYVKGDYSMLAFNYLTCSVVSLLFIGDFSQVIPSTPQAPLLLLQGCVNGIMFLASLVMMHVCVKKNGVVLPVVYSKLGLIIPILASVVLFGETMSGFQILGTILSIIAVVLMNYEPGTGFDFNFFLLALLVVDGFTSSLSKVFEFTGLSAYNSQYLFYTFFTALILCSLFVLKHKERPGLMEALFGIGVGIPNFFASRFVLKALETIPAVIVYPIRGVCIIVTVAIVGVLFFRERMTKLKWIGFVVILAAVALLNL